MVVRPLRCRTTSSITSYDLSHDYCTNIVWWASTSHDVVWRRTWRRMTSHDHLKISHMNENRSKFLNMTKNFQDTVIPRWLRRRATSHDLLSMVHSSLVIV